MASPFTPAKHEPILVRIRWVWAAFILSLIFAPPAVAAGPNFPRLTGRVVDDAHVLSVMTRLELTHMLAAHESATGEQVVVVTLASLQGLTIEDYGYQLGRYWGIGQKRENNGALLIVAPKEHQVRIEVGYGLEGELTDATCSTIINNYILPSFKRGDFNAGVLAGTRLILGVLGGNPAISEPGPSEGQSPYSLSNASGPPTPLEWAVIFLIFLGIPLIAVLRAIHNIRRGEGNAYVSSGRRDTWGSNGRSTGSDGGSFSGGGGSFGGGGASGHW